MKHFKLLLLAAVAAGLSPAVAQELRSVTNPEQLGFSSAHLQRLTDAYQGYVDRGELPGAVLLIARGDKIAYLQAVGYQDREKKTPMKVDAIFRLASMTKPIVSVAAMMLVEEGKLDLLAPVAQYLSEFKDLKVGVEHRHRRRQTGLDPRATAPSDERAGFAATHLGAGVRPKRRRSRPQGICRRQRGRSGAELGRNGDEAVENPARAPAGPSVGI